MDTTEETEHGIIFPRSQALVNHAYSFAKEAHGDQVRKYTGEPYVTHPVAVAKILLSHGIKDINMICAAILHDVVEDTPVGYDDLIHAGFMWPIANLVMDLTDVAVMNDGNREVRTALNRAHTANSHPDAQTVKLADLIHNTDSIVEHDPNFAKVYMKEKQLLMEVLIHGDPTLFDVANQRIMDYYLGKNEPTPVSPKYAATHEFKDIT